MHSRRCFFSGNDGTDAMVSLVTGSGVWLVRLLVLTSGLVSHVVWADDFPLPSGDVVLTITGNIEASNQPEKLVFDLPMLEKYPQTSFVTNTPWTEEPTKWTGVRLNDLFSSFGVETVAFKATAIDDYIVEFKDVDVERYPVIIAYKKNDEYMSRRDLGPLWIMFPFDDYKELNTQANWTVSVWQLIQIDVF